MVEEHEDILKDRLHKEYNDTYWERRYTICQVREEGEEEKGGRREGGRRRRRRRREGGKRGGGGGREGGGREGDREEERGSLLAVQFRVLELLFRLQNQVWV